MRTFPTAKVADHDRVLVRCHERFETALQTRQLRWCRVDDEYAVLDPVAVGGEHPRDALAPSIIRHVVCDQVPAQVGSQRVLIPTYVS